MVEKGDSNYFQYRIGISRYRHIRNRGLHPTTARYDLPPRQRTGLLSRLQGLGDVTDSTCLWWNQSFNLANGSDQYYVKQPTIYISGRCPFWRI